MQEYVQVILGVTLCVIGILLVIAVVLNLRMRRSVRKSENELLDNYQSLRQAYDEVSLERAELAERCEELSKGKERMQKTAYTDYLTCLPNRLGYSEYLENELRMLGKNDSIAIVNVDVDNFKLINESYGHSYGDDTLREVARRLTRLSLERGAYLARIGGDEFTLLTNKEDSGYAEAIAERIRAYNGTPIVYNGMEIPVALHIAVTKLSPEDTKQKEMFDRLLHALWEVKNTEE